MAVIVTALSFKGGINRGTAAFPRRIDVIRIYSTLIEFSTGPDRAIRRWVSNGIVNARFLPGLNVPLPTKGFIRHYLGKPDLASRSRGLQLIGFGAFEPRPGVIHRDTLHCDTARDACACNSVNETRRFVVVLPPTTRERPQITGSKAQRDHARARQVMQHQRQS